MTKSILLISLLVHFQSFGQNPRNEVVISDIQLFWKSYDLLSNAKNRKDSVQTFNENYINKVSAGLSEYFKYDKSIQNVAEKYIDLIQRFPNYYRSIRYSTVNQEGNSKKIKKIISKYRLIFPTLNIPKITLGVGFFGTGGLRVDDSSNVFIGTEYYFSKSADFKEFGSKPTFLHPANTIPEVAIHEITHTNLKNADSTMLFSCLGEGAGVFMTTLIAGNKALTGPGGIPEKLLSYILSNRNSLFEDFEEDIYKLKNDSSVSKWFYGNDELNYPSLLNYGLSYFICKSYYDNSPDKSKAIREIVTLKNYKNIWTESRIGQK